MIEEIRKYISEYEDLKDGHISLDFLGENVGDYSIETNPCTSLLQPYTDGSGEYQYQFYFISREQYNQDYLVNLANSKFYEDFSNWINTNNNQGILPDIKGIQTIECMNNGGLAETSEKEAVYQILMRITYIREEF